MVVRPFTKVAQKFPRQGLPNLLTKGRASIAHFPSSIFGYVSPIQKARQGKKPDRKSPEMAQFPLSF
jgi:hypothetical protein